MSLTLLAAPAVEPLSLDQAKAVLRIGHDADDARILHLIRAARQRLEAETGRALVAQTWRESRDSWADPSRLAAFGTQFRLLRPPLIAVEAVRLRAADGTVSLWDPSEYEVDVETEPGRIVLKPGAAFPEPGAATSGLRIDFRAGHGEVPEDVPAPLVEAVAHWVAGLHAGSADPALRLPPPAVEALIAPWRRRRL
jgi:uncharacterized phiE125 gp8 family phage protein